MQEAELTLPIAQYVRLEVRELADLAYRVELLDRFDSHSSRSGRRSRDMRAVIAARGSHPSKRTRATPWTIGISIPSFFARSQALSVVTTPSATVSRSARMSSSLRPRPISTPNVRLRDRAPVHVSTRSPR